MEMKKHVLAWGLAVGCLFGSTSVAEAASFSDIGPTDTLKPIVEELNDKGIVSGYPDGTYRPQTKMERQHVAALLSRAVPLPAVKPGKAFKDVLVTHRNYSDIRALQRAGIIDGTANGYFQPKGPITRAQMAKILTETFQLKNDGVTHPFKDVPSTHWANGAIGALYANDITSGNSHGNFQPEGVVTRGEYARFLHRALLLKGNGTIERPTHAAPARVKEFSSTNDTFYYYGVGIGSTKQHLLASLGKPTKTMYDTIFHEELIFYGKIQFIVKNNKIESISIPTTQRKFDEFANAHPGKVFLDSPYLLTSDNLLNMAFYSDHSILMATTDYNRYINLKAGNYRQLK